MRRYRNLLIIPAIAFSICMGHSQAAFADESFSQEQFRDLSVSGDAVSDETVPKESVSQNVAPEASVSENTVSENIISENTVSENNTEKEAVSENIIPEQNIPENTVSQDVIPVKEISGIRIFQDKVIRNGRSAEIRIKVESTGSKIMLVEAENKAVGIKKKLYRASGGSTDSSLALKLSVRVNGRYAFHAMDSEGNKDSCEVYVSEFSGRSFSDYSDRAKANAKSTAGAGSATYGGRGTKTGKALSGGRNYSVKNGTGLKTDSAPDTDKYSQWSLLKGKDRKKDRKNEERAWYEPGIEGIEEDTVGNLQAVNEDNVLPGLSDYGIKLFRTAALGTNEGASGEVSPSLPVETSGLKLASRDDNIDSMGNDNSVMIIGIVVFILILLMLTAAFLLLRSHNKDGRKKKVRVKIKRAAKSPSGKNGTAVKSGKRGKTAAKNPRTQRSTKSTSKPALKNAGAAAGTKTSKPVPLKGPGDEGIEKYARMTEDYVRSKFGIELKRVDLKKYYSDRHGFDCVDFTYMPASGVLPAQFRTHLNDVDTALSNVSGVDTITFAVDNTTGTYRTTFYLGK